ncbi:MAG TPA: hypothetical protein DE179_12100 [Oceanospirillaceae bacterium]|nr:hypothetical protein [Oceanospirillaceae bacterium]
MNPEAAVRADDIIAEKVELLIDHPSLGVVRGDRKGRCLVIPEVSMNGFYKITDGLDEITIV